MEAFGLLGILAYLIILVWGILNIILFFKIWGMTNDVREIKERLLFPSNNSIKVDNNPSDSNKEDKASNFNIGSRAYEVGEIVYDIKSGKELIIRSIEKDGYYCWTDKNKTRFAHYSNTEIGLPK